MIEIPPEDQITEAFDPDLFSYQLELERDQDQQDLQPFEKIAQLEADNNL